MWWKGNLFALLLRMQIDTVTVESSMEIAQKNVKMDLPFHPVILLLGIYPKELKTLNGKNISTPMFLVALFTIAKTWKQLKCPSVDEWIKQLWNIYTMGYYLAIKKKTFLPFATVQMDLENIMQNEISQLETEKYHKISLMCGI